MFDKFKIVYDLHHIYDNGILICLWPEIKKLQHVGYSVAVYFYISKAFDTINHHIYLVIYNVIVSEDWY